MGSAQSVPPNGRLDTAFTASANRMLGEMFSSEIALFKLGQCLSSSAIIAFVTPSGEAGDHVVRRRARRDQRQGRRSVTCREIPGMPAMGGLTIEPDTSSASMMRLPVGSTLSNAR